MDISTPAKREAWNKKLNGRYWNGNRTQYKAKDRLWVTTTLTNDLYMVNPTVLKDEDGDEVYKVIFVIDRDGLPRSDWGNIRSYDRMYTHTKYTKPVSDDHSTKIDAWLATAKEGVYRQDRNGMNMPHLDIEPLNLKVPGWTRLTKKQLDDSRKGNLLALVKRSNVAGREAPCNIAP